MRALTKDHEGKLIEVEALVFRTKRYQSPNRIGVYKCRIANGNVIARHATRLEFLPEPAGEEDVS